MDIGKIAARTAHIHEIGIPEAITPRNTLRI